MCRSIKTLHNFTPPATDEEIRASSLQFVRKLSGFHAAFESQRARVRARRGSGGTDRARAARFSRDERAASRSRHGSVEGTRQDGEPFSFSRRETGRLSCVSSAAPHDCA
jgi:hypothetical protein